MTIYFDNSATTVLHAKVWEAMQHVLQYEYGNPSSLHRLGTKAEQFIVQARKMIATYLQVRPNEVIFTSGGTESNNLALKGTAFAYERRGKHLIISAVEHSSIFETAQILQNHFGFELTILPVDEQGRVDPEEVAKALREDTILVSIMHVNNELGTIQPVEEIGSILKNYPKVLFHVDAVQSIGKVPLNIKNSSIDLLSLSAHKIHGPKGSGCLYVRQGVQLFPLQHGGAQENKVRPGTENVAGIVGMATAIQLAKADEQVHIQHLEKLKRALLDFVEHAEHMTLNTPASSSLSAPHIVNVSFNGLKGEVLLHALEEQGIYVSTKSACSSKRQAPSRVLIAAGLSQKRADSAIRISFSPANTLAEVAAFQKAVQDILPLYRKVMRA